MGKEKGHVNVVVIGESLAALRRAWGRAPADVALSLLASSPSCVSLCRPRRLRQVDHHRPPHLQVRWYRQAYHREVVRPLVSHRRSRPVSLAPRLPLLTVRPVPPTARRRPPSSARVRFLAFGGRRKVRGEVRSGAVLRCSSRSLSPRVPAPRSPVPLSAALTCTLPTRFVQVRLGS